MAALEPFINIIVGDHGVTECLLDVMQRQILMTRQHVGLLGHLYHQELPRVVVYKLVYLVDSVQERAALEHSVANVDVVESTGRGRSGVRSQSQVEVPHSPDELVVHGQVLAPANSRERRERGNCARRRVMRPRQCHLPEPRVRTLRPEPRHPVSVVDDDVAVALGRRGHEARELAAVDGEGRSQPVEKACCVVHGSPCSDDPTLRVTSDRRRLMARRRHLPLSRTHQD
mmetsp:Transcript_35700/g.85150  ORF Transcript_35700/g.85150 Transcript_35700/m.85150 type:complete len:229 (-) Transcript_35700:215-901(-)